VSRYYAKNGELVIEQIVDNMCSSSFQIPTVNDGARFSHRGGVKVSQLT
jgi:hypothetical protein